LNSYFTSIGRLYRKDKRHQSILKNTKPLFTLVNNTLKKIIDTRGAHVHKTRFSDEDLDRLRSQELLTDHDDEEFRIISNLFKINYAVTRRRYKKTIKSNNEQIKKLLDACFHILFEIVANNEGEIKYPKIGTT
jgi:hypothetical protein